MFPYVSHYKCFLVFAHSWKHGETLVGNNVSATMFPSSPRALRQFSIAVALPARAERTLLNFLCSCLTCAFFVRLNARGHAMKVELHSTFLACPRDWFFTWLKLVAPPARAKRPQWKMAFRALHRNRRAAGWIPARDLCNSCSSLTGAWKLRKLSCKLSLLNSHPHLTTTINRLRICHMDWCQWAQLSDCKRCDVF